MDLKIILASLVLISCDSNGICPASPCSEERLCDDGLTCLKDHNICAIPCIINEDCPTDSFQNMKCYMNYCVDGDGITYNYCSEELVN